MRSVSACLLFVLAAAVVSAQSTCTAPTSDALNPTGVTGCAPLTACKTALTSCTTSAASSCTNTAACYATYFQCLTAVTLQRSNASLSGCANYAQTLYMAQLSAATSTSNFTTTDLYKSCNYDLCLLTNGSTCANATSSVCTSANLVGQGSNPPTTTLSPAAYDILATMRMSGDWTTILQNSTAVALLSLQLQEDIAILLGLGLTFVQILSLLPGSLVVQFGILPGTGMSTASLNSAVTTIAASPAQFNNIQTLYANSGGSGSVLTISVGVNSTGAPPSPSPASSLSAAGVVVAAAIAAVAALFA